MFSKTSDSKITVASSRAAEGNTIAYELRRLVLFSIALWIFLALVSYSPTDPSWSTWSSKANYGNWMGRMGSIAADMLLQLFGLTAFVFPLVPVAFAVRKSNGEEANWKTDFLGPWILLLSLSSLFQSMLRASWMPWKLSHPGGIMGSIMARLLTYFSGSIGAKMISVCLFLGAVIVVFRWRVLFNAVRFSKTHAPTFKESVVTLAKELPGRIKALWPKREAAPVSIGVEPVTHEVAPPAILPAVPDTKSEARVVKIEEDSENPLYAIVSDMVQPTTIHKVPKNRVHRGRYKDFQLPSLGLLSGKAESKVKSVDKSWYVEKANILVQKLKDFGVEGEVVHISPGPVITVYEFKPASGVKIKEISNLTDDLTLALSALSVRIVAPIPGKPVVGIEIPSPHREMVFFKDMIQETPFFKGDLKIPIVLGRMASGEPVAADLASMPHLLIAGTTGTGKSVFINTLISSLLYRFSPEQLKLILVDPKMVELSHYDSIPHLLLPVVVDSKKAVLALRWTVDEMERRYTTMHQFGVRHVDQYNEKVAEMRKNGDDEFETLPYIVVVIDEYADLMAVVPKEVELSIARLAQKARASGIHLVLGTQRPSTDVVTGTIKANFPSRISFRVASSIDSKTILDRTGAERLLGHGDMLIHSAGFMSLRRMQGPFLSDADLARIVTHLKEQGEPEYDERILQAQEEGDNLLLSGIDGDDSDDENALYDRAVRIVTEKGEASISLIQRHLKIGYNRAATLMERMEKEGVVGAAAGPAKRRSVLVGNL